MTLSDKKKYPHCYDGHEYAEKVVSGKILACKYIVGACERYLRDLEDPRFKFDKEKAERYLRLIQKFPHVIGHWKTKNIVYLPWQKFCWMNIIGFLNKETGQRRFRLAHIEVPRGSSKSTMASQCVLYFLALDNPNGNMISTVATKKDQARIVLDSARNMAKKSEDYRQHTGVKVLAHTLVHPKSNSIARALSSEHSGLDGLQDVLAVCDELHAMNRQTFDVIYSGMSKRTDSLTLCITTAGFDVDSVGFSQTSYAKKVAIGEVNDEQFFSAVYTVDEGDDVFSEETWKKANPGWGDSVDIETFTAKARKAEISPADLPNFKVKHLNIWLSEAKAFFDVNKWDSCADPSLNIDNFKNDKCIIGIDLASKIDLTSIAYVFRKDDIYYIFDRSFIPEVTVSQVRNTLYDECIASGHLIQTKGEAIHYPDIAKEIVENSKKFKIQEALFDPWNSSSFAQELQQKRINMVEFRFNTANLSEPTKNLDALIRQGKIRHNGSPLLRWCLGNVVCKYDAADNVFPRKTHERLKIDPIIAIIMAMASWTQKEEKKSVYEDRPIRFL
jgi:phage terminase large subunit-like protein